MPSDQQSGSYFSFAADSPYKFSRQARLTPKKSNQDLYDDKNVDYKEHKPIRSSSKLHRAPQTTKNKMIIMNQSQIKMTQLQESRVKDSSDSKIVEEPQPGGIPSTLTHILRDERDTQGVGLNIPETSIDLNLKQVEQETQTMRNIQSLPIQNRINPPHLLQNSTDPISEENSLHSLGGMLQTQKASLISQLMDLDHAADDDAAATSSDKNPLRRPQKVDDDNILVKEQLLRQNRLIEALSRDLLLKRQRNAAMTIQAVKGCSQEGVFGMASGAKMKSPDKTIQINVKMPNNRHNMYYRGRMLVDSASLGDHKAQAGHSSLVSSPKQHLNKGKVNVHTHRHHNFSSIDATSSRHAFPSFRMKIDTQHANNVYGNTMDQRKNPQNFITFDSGDQQTQQVNELSPVQLAIYQQQPSSSDGHPSNRTAFFKKQSRDYGVDVIKDKLGNYSIQRADLSQDNQQNNLTTQLCSPSTKIKLTATNQTTSAASPSHNLIDRSKVDIQNESVFNLFMNRSLIHNSILNSVNRKQRKLIREHRIKLRYPGGASTLAVGGSTGTETGPSHSHTPLLAQSLENPTQNFALLTNSQSSDTPDSKIPAQFVSANVSQEVIPTNRAYVKIQRQGRHLRPKGTISVDCETQTVDDNGTALTEFPLLSKIDIDHLNNPSVSCLPLNILSPQHYTVPFSNRQLISTLTPHPAPLHPGPALDPAPAPATISHQQEQRFILLKNELSRKNLKVQVCELQHERFRIEECAKKKEARSRERTTESKFNDFPSFHDPLQTHLLATLHNKASTITTLKHFKALSDSRSTKKSGFIKQTMGGGESLFSKMETNLHRATAQNLAAATDLKTSSEGPEQQILVRSDTPGLLEKLQRGATTATATGAKQIGSGTVSPVARGEEGSSTDPQLSNTEKREQTRKNSIEMWQGEEEENGAAENTFTMDCLPTQDKIEEQLLLDCIKKDGGAPPTTDTDAMRRIVAKKKSIALQVIASAQTNTDNSPIAELSPDAIGSNYMETSPVFSPLKPIQFSSDKRDQKQVFTIFHRVRDGDGIEERGDEGQEGQLLQDPSQIYLPTPFNPIPQPKSTAAPATTLKPDLSQNVVLGSNINCVKKVRIAPRRAKKAEVGPSISLSSHQRQTTQNDMPTINTQTTPAASLPNSVMIPQPLQQRAAFITKVKNQRLEMDTTIPHTLDAIGSTARPPEDPEADYNHNVVTLDGGLEEAEKLVGDLRFLSQRGSSTTQKTIDARKGSTSYRPSYQSFEKRNAKATATNNKDIAVALQNSFYTK